MNTGGSSEKEVLVTDTYRLTDRYTADSGTVFMTGIQALARLPIEQLRVDRANGLQTAAFAAGYPGSPLGGYDSAVDAARKQVPDLPFEHVHSVNEEHAATAVMGTQLACTRPDARYDGVVGLWYGKAPGIDRASDAMRHAVFAGTDPNGGAVALVGDDPLAKSSTVPSSSAGTLADMHIPVLYPGTPTEALDLGRHAIALSRATGLWAGLKIVADVADGSSNVDLDPHRVQPILPLIDGKPYAHLPDGALVPPHIIELEREIYEVRYHLAVEYGALNDLNHTTVDPPDAWIGIVSSGITYREVREALSRLGLETDHDIASAGIRLLKLQMPLPFNFPRIQSFAQGLDEIFVLEEKHPNVESLIKDALYNQAVRPLVVGKTDELGKTLTPSHGALTADQLIHGLRARLTPKLGDRIRPARPEREMIPLAVNRTPFFCSGCPHNRSTVVDEGTLVGAGIGCHTMVMLQDNERFGDVAGLTCMGNEGTQWIGMSPFIETNHLIQNLGDGTFFHSGQLAITSAIAADVNITYKLLWNGAVAMTGGQDPTGRLPLGQVARNLLGHGVKRVIITTDDVDRTASDDIPYEIDVWDRDRLLDAQRELAAIDGVTVLIHDQRCAAEQRRDRKRGRIKTPPTRVVINQRVCEGCGDCASVSNCLSVQPIETPFGRKTTIDQDSCNLDLSCLEGDCPAFTAVVERPDRWWRPSVKAKVSMATILPAPDSIPAPPVSEDHDVSVHITGIGGTGVVTISQILGTAAMLEGADVSGLDQIGLSQKAGPVVSDVRITHDRPVDSSRVGAGQADLLLAFDLLVASSWTGLNAADPTRTAVVGSIALTPPGRKIARPETEMPEVSELVERIDASTQPGRKFWADAYDLTSVLVGDPVAANIFVVGMAIQSGFLPILPSSLEEAITLNGVAVERNVTAFRWGRMQVADPEMVAAAADAARVEPPKRLAPPKAVSNAAAELSDDGPLRDELERFGAELTLFQNSGLAAEFFADLRPVRDAELALDPTSDRLTLSAARGLFKLLAYKDEYEVARLLLLPDPTVEEVAGPSAKTAWKLHPPTLRALGRSKKMSLSTRWGRPVMVALRAAKRVRGTPLDPFGRAEVRKVERALPAEYLTALHAASAGLTADTFDHAIEVAELPELVRGYENIKMRNVELFRARLAELAS
ncbi:MAG: indolepyruvate ferredoxin oxidoreductase family protein [Actinobacteria bacterium]|nr:indolepyruvate ferredoxin oxidoreductase family protein [Actinomycetota bacterium]